MAADAPESVLAALGAKPDPLTGAIRAPSESTPRRVLAGVDAAELQRRTGQWMMTPEVVEERGLATGNTASATRPGHRAGSGAPHALDRVREVARRDKGTRFTALLHHVDLDRLRAASWAIRPSAAPGWTG